MKRKEIKMISLNIALILLSLIIPSTRTQDYTLTSGVYPPQASVTATITEKNIPTTLEVDAPKSTITKEDLSTLKDLKTTSTVVPQSSTVAETKAAVVSQTPTPIDDEVTVKSNPTTIDVTVVISGNTDAGIQDVTVENTETTLKETAVTFGGSTTDRLSTTVEVSSTTVVVPKTIPTVLTTTQMPVITTLEPPRFPVQHVPSRLEERLEALDCDVPLLPTESRLWRGNETHELMLPITIPEDCPAGPSDPDCLPMVLSWEGSAEIQSGDVLLVQIDDSQLILSDAVLNRTRSHVHEDRMHHAPQTAVYQVTRPGHDHCDITEGVLLDITPLLVDGRKLVTLYDKDLTEGVNLLIVVSESWGSQCVRLRVTVKSDNCGDNEDCSGKGVCFSNVSMEGYECQCCPGFVGPHCEEQDACYPSPCTNNGICVDISQGHEGNTYQCLCPYGYTGKNCQEETDPCSSMPCQNGATCTGNMTQFRCDCPRGFAGPLCQHNLNECESSPCVHGICVDQEDGYRCFCQPGFAGQHCDYEYNECESSPCINGGTCIDRIGGYTCNCGRGYTGKRCHIKVDLCSPNPCPAHRYCVDRGDNFSCECPRGHSGPDCLIPSRAVRACSTNPCANGGTCWSSVDSFYCACRPGFTGKICEDEFIVESVVGAELGPGPGELQAPIGGAHLQRLHNVYIAAGTLAAAITIVGLVVAACHCRVNKTYQRFLLRAYPLFPWSRKNTSSAPHHHWLSDKHGGDKVPHACFTGHHGNHAQNLPGLDSADMYYTLDFGDSQSSPLIQ